MRFVVITACLARVPLLRLEDIGAAMMSVPNPSGYTFESLMPPAAQVRPKKETRH